MIQLIIEWLGTIFLLIGGIFFTSKKASNPKFRLYGLIAYITGVVFYILFGIIIQAYGLLLTQVVFLILNAKGVVYCVKEMKNVRI